MHDQLRDGRADHAHREVKDEAAAAPEPLDGQAEHPDREHVEENVIEVAVQEGVRQ